MIFPHCSDPVELRAYYESCFDHFYAEETVADHPAVQHARSIVHGLPFTVIPSLNAMPPEHRSARTLLAVGPRGNAVGRCPGTRGHICCNYLTVDLYTGCNLGCSYCIMQSYLNFSPISVRVDNTDSISRLRSIAEQNSDRIVRVGTGETGDSLWLDPLFGLSAALVDGTAEYRNLVLELKTKTDFVDHLLGSSDPERVVFGFSLNPQSFSAVEEYAAVEPARRLAAAQRAAAAGYRVAFHFDPIVRGEGLQEAYHRLCYDLAQIPSERIAWISMGTIRYPKELRDALPDRPYLLDEFVPARDGKYRYIQRDRVELYTDMLAAIRDSGIESPVYLCMESAVVWRRVFSVDPQSLPGYAELFRPIQLGEVKPTNSD